MGRFSRRHDGVQRSPLRRDEVPPSLRHHLWTVVFEVLDHYTDRELLFAASGSAPERAFLDGFFAEVLGYPVSVRSSSWEPASLQPWFYQTASWTQVYDAIDYIVCALPHDAVGLFNAGLSPQGYASRFNAILEQELAPWRFIGSELVPISSAEEVAAVGDALEGAPRLVREHLQRAIDNLAQRPEPAVHGAITESIQAVESMAKHVLQRSDGTYGLLKQSLQKLGVHAAFVHAFDKLYGYTSDEGGLRHAFKPGDDPTKHPAEGRLFVVMASAYVNFLQEFYADR